MKKLCIIISVLFLSVMADAQNTNAIGVRLWGSDGISAEISYQHFISGPNRIEADLGFIDAGWYDGFKATLMYHWVNNIEGGLNWYIGAGGSLGGWDIDAGKPGNDDFHNEGFFLDANGQIGIEYHFDFPLQLSLDGRPEIGLINDDFDFGYGLGIRFTF